MSAGHKNAGARFFQLCERRSVRWCGLMSGTSADGIDAAVVEFSEGELRPRVLGGVTIPFSAAVTERLIDDLRQPPSVETAAAWDRELAHAFAEAALRAREEVGDFDAVALSGHTFAHLPQLPSTLQLGNPALVAQRLDRPVVAGFRATDVARGGEGAPLVPAADRKFFGEPNETVVVLNVGGISNLTWLPAGYAMEPRARDCGPGNLVLNAVIQRGTDGREPYDRDGRRAAAGGIDAARVSGWLDHPFYASERRSTGREDFGESWVEAHAAQPEDRTSMNDTLASLCDWIAQSVARSWQILARSAAPDEASPQRCLIGGGGAHHDFLRDRIQRHLGVEVTPLTEARFGVSADLREAAAFAALGQEYLHGRPASFPGTTGCDTSGPLGALWLP